MVMAARVLPENVDRFDRLCAALLFGGVLPIVEVTLLSLVGALAPLPMVVLATLVPVGVCFAAGSAARKQAWADARAYAAGMIATFRSPVHAVALAPALAALMFVAVAAGGLELWSWDSLGYHLPLVYDALDVHRFREVPTHIPYINVYPRGGERLFAFARLLLPDDTWIDLAQLPGALGAVAVTFAFARRAGVRAPLALVCASLWLAVPAVALQIPTNYVDVYFACWLLCAAYFVTGSLDFRRAGLVGLALAMMLACKAVALVPAAMCGGFFLVRAVRAHKIRLALVATLVASFGCAAYVRNMLRYGNPVWPVEVVLGPLRFAGQDPVGPMYVQGLDPTVAALPAPLRFVVSLMAEPRHYLYDMRLGGFGPVVQVLMLALPIAAAVFLWRRRRAALTGLGGLWGPALVVCATAALPMAQWPRFALAVPAAMLVAAALVIEAVGERARTLAVGALSLAALVGLMRALPAFTGNDGTPLLSLVNAPFDQRLRAVSIDGAPLLWHALKAPLAPGEAIAYDNSVEAPGLLWRRDGRTRVVYLDVKAPPADPQAWLREHRVRAVLLGRKQEAERMRTALGTRLQRRVACPEDPCDIYDVQP